MSKLASRLGSKTKNPTTHLVGLLGSRLKARPGQQLRLALPSEQIDIATLLAPAAASTL